MLTIRLQRTGKRNQAQYRLVLSEKTAHVSKSFNEILGSYNPHTKELKVKNQERLQHWIDQHIALSPTVHNLLVGKGLLKGDKVKAFSIPKKAEEVKKETAKAEAPTEVAAEVPTETPEQSAPENSEPSA